MKTDFIKSNLFTGFIVLLPIALLAVVLTWIYGIIANMLAPVANLLGIHPILATLISLFALVVLVFLVGIVMRTNIGRWFVKAIEKYFLYYIPGYNLMKDITKPFAGDGFKKSFKSVALVNIYENSMMVTAFVTDRNEEKGITTVFVPTGPNPTSGQIFHVKNKYVHPVNASVDSVLKSVLAVGSGSKKLLDKIEK